MLASEDTEAKLKKKIKKKPSAHYLYNFNIFKLLSPHVLRVIKIKRCFNSVI